MPCPASIRSAIALPSFIRRTRSFARLRDQREIGISFSTAESLDLESGTPVDMYDDSLELRELQMNWGVRLNFQTPTNNDYVPLLSVAPPSVNTDAYLGHSPSIYY